MSRDNGGWHPLLGLWVSLRTTGMVAEAVGWPADKIAELPDAVVEGLAVVTEQWQKSQRRDDGR